VERTLDPFDAPVRTLPEADEETLVLALDGWEGPLDLLLHLARHQRVDLAKLSILALVEQYLDYINRARKLRLELAADYLVMAAWLAYLKSCLLLPKEAQEEPSAEELALRLQMQLQRLDAMREAGARLMARDQMGRDVFGRGAPEGLRVVRSSAYDCTLYELLKAYGNIRGRSEHRVYEVKRRPVFALDDALHRVEAMLGIAIEWTEIARFLPDSDDPVFRRSALASTFAAALELAKQGRAELSQADTFGPLHMKARS
jgi:segregation and condensation protein A